MKSSVASTLKKVADILKICSIVVMGGSAFLCAIISQTYPSAIPAFIMVLVYALALFVGSFFMSGFSLVVEACFLYIREIDPKEADELTTITQKKEPEETALPMD